MNVEILAAVVLLFTALIVAAKGRAIVLAILYRTLQLGVLTVLVGTAVIVLTSPSWQPTVAGYLEAAPIVNSIQAPDPWAAVWTWVLRAVTLAGVAGVALVLIQFLQQLTSICASHVAMRDEFSAAYEEIHGRLEQIEASSGGDNNVGDVRSAMDQMRALLQRS